MSGKVKKQSTLLGVGTNQPEERHRTEGPFIENKLGLHQEVRVIYVVTGYQAMFEQEDGRVGNEFEGEVMPSVHAAIESLEQVMRKYQEDCDV